jgi:hypothetical protein
MPASQSTQAAPDHRLPAPQVIQLLELKLPTEEVVPEEQEPQTFTLFTSLDCAPASAYLPSGQIKGKQAPPLPLENVPARHIVQSFIELLPAGDE